MKEPRRFWSKVDIGEPGECWEWQASKSEAGYGNFWVNYRTWLAHRVAWVLTFGPIPEGLCVCHKCDNPGCINPYHLFLGTHANNTMDAVEKGRLHTKLTKEDVLQIRELLEEGVPKQQIADEFGVSKKSVGDIKRGKFWSWLI
jgi:hypothetical protein